ncbi:helix-turn-helix domain-containing protein [Roseovarius aestuariivivens]|uniref:helix-turn-helix domain-containing protein n=1 Tax=Roseovarius aestuariivivens TaxID=1888910 RepID=UPI0010803A17|nr:helix-turn-helix domain-containing protein [Roseovarius aestuariivivens]
MAKRPSPFRIKTHRIYTPAEAAEVLKVHRQSVRRWITQHGLTADTSRKPWLIKGSDLKNFLGHRREKRRCKLQLHHCYCLGCKGPREPDGKMADYQQHSPTSGMLTALCPTCGSLMHKVIRRDDLDAIQAKIEVTIQRPSPRLVSRTDAPLNVTFQQEANDHAKTQR